MTLPLRGAAVGQFVYLAVDPRKALGQCRDDQPRPPRRQQQSDRPAEQADQKAFRHELSHETASSRADRQELREHGVKYSAMVQTYSNLRMEVRLTQSSHEPGATLSLAATITEYGGPFRGSATVSVDVTRPDDTLVKYALVHEGEGHYSADVPAPIAGTYGLRVRAGGTTHRGRPFTREQLRTASVWAGGDRPKDPSGGRPGDGDGGGKPGDGGIFDLLCCLYQNDGLRGQFWERLVQLGIDPEVLRRCLERLCKDRETTSPQTATVPLSTAQIRDIEVQLERSKAAVLAALRG